MLLCQCDLFSHPSCCAETTQLQVVYRVILPQVMPRLLDAVRISLGAAWLFLIAAEAIASTDGLGYRIFLVRRYLAMDVIIPYVLRTVPFARRSRS